MKISVAMCTYNGSKYLPEQLDSFMHQSRLPDEVVICDDKSTDSTPEILQSFASTAPFSVRLVGNKANLGSTQNFEQCVALCEGEIIALADQDDVWHPSKLEVIERAFVEEPLTGLVFSDARVVDESLRPMGYTMWEAMSFTKEKQDLVAAGGSFSLFVHGNIVTGATAAYRRTLNEIAIPFPPASGLRIHDGWIALVASAVSGVRPIASCLIDYRQHPGQQIGAPPKAQVGREGSTRRVLPRGHILKQLEDLDHIHERLLRISGKTSWSFGERLHSLSGRVKHLKMRASLPRRRTSRIVPVAKSLLSGDYHRFSNGWRSVVRDLAERI